jgi:hypothetical protein
MGPNATSQGRQRGGRRVVRERFHGGGAEGLPHVSMELGIRLELSSLSSSMSYLYTPTSVGAEDLASWRGSVAGCEGSFTYFYLQHFWIWKGTKSGQEP